MSYAARIQYVKEDALAPADRAHLESHSQLLRHVNNDDYAWVVEALEQPHPIYDDPLTWVAIDRTGDHYRRRLIRTPSRLDADFVFSLMTNLGWP